MNFILGTKHKMTQIFTETGEAIPVTVIKAGPCQITQVRESDKDGFVAVQIGYGEKKKLNKSILGHLKNLTKSSWLKEFQVPKSDSFNPERGQQLAVDTFAVGDKVRIVGISKGKGFQGVVRRHGFHGSPASHGHKDQLRMPGSIGATDPARVFKGTRMAGRMGGGQVTVTNLEVVKIDTEQNLLYIRGAVPGPRSGMLTIVGTGELKLTAKQEEVKAEKSESVEDKSETKANTNKTEPKVEEKKSEVTSEKQVAKKEDKPEVKKDNK